MNRSLTWTQLAGIALNCVLLTAAPVGFSSAVAQTPAAVGAENTDDAVKAPIVALNAALLQAMKTGQSVPFEQRYAKLAPVVEHTYNLQAALQATVGLRWNEFPDDQKKQLLEAFTRFTVASYVANFDHYTGENLVVTGLRAQGNDQVVLSQVVPPNGSPTDLDYVMRKNDKGEWQVVDVLLDGAISRAAVTRSDFRVLLSGGNGATALIENLQQKSADMAAGKQH